MSSSPFSRRVFLAGAAALLGIAAAGCSSRSANLPLAADSPVPDQIEPVAPPTVQQPTASPTAASPTPLPTRTPIEIAAPKLMGREAWGARPANGAYRAHAPERITVHHTAVSWKGGDTPNHLRGIQAFHQGPERRWVDIAYHYLIDLDGAVYVGRPELAMPDTATAGYDPAGHLAVCVLGNFDLQQPTEVQIATLSQTLAWLLNRYPLSISTLGGHRDFAATSCPGERLYVLLRDGGLAARVRGLMDRA